jgi:hypothetical protein
MITDCFSWAPRWIDIDIRNLLQNKGGRTEIAGNPAHGFTGDERMSEKDVSAPG